MEVLDRDLVASRLTEIGVRTTPDELRVVPYVVTLSDAIFRHLWLHPS